jgi:transmembrane sensor
MNDEKLIGYISGEITSEIEITEILDWIESSVQNQERYNHLKNLWVATGLDHPDEVDIPVFIYPETRRIRLSGMVFRSFLKYAAVFILAFILGSLSFYFIRQNEYTDLSSLYNTIEVPYGQRSHMTLYDGTKVWLNSGTKFRYPVAFNPHTREVFLEGEAYFNVAKDPNHPFVLNAGRLKVKVLGTHFNVCAYPGDNEFSTTLDEGSVDAVDTKSGLGVILSPGEQVVLNRKMDGMKSQKVDTELYTSWKENLLKFEDAPFEEVVKKMQRWYDVKIIVDPSMDVRQRFTMTVKTESLREVLQLVSKTTKMNYEINKNKVVIKKP